VIGSQHDRGIDRRIGVAAFDLCERFVENPLVEVMALAV
jgi:hypothetical protein